MKMWFSIFAVSLTALLCLPLVLAQYDEGEEAAPPAAAPAAVQPAVAPAAPAAPVAGGALTWQEALTKVGQVVTVEAQIIKVFDPEAMGKGGPVKLNVDQDYKTSLTFAYYKKDRQGNPSPIGDPEQYLFKTVRVTGMVTDYQGSKQIMIKSAADIQIVK